MERCWPRFCWRGQSTRSSETKRGNIRITFWFMDTNRREQAVSALQSLLGGIARLTAPRAARVDRTPEGAERILNYLREAAGFLVDIKPGVPIRESKSLWDGQPLAEEDALVLLKQALTGIGCTVLRKGRMLTIVTAEEAKKCRIPLPTIGEPSAARG